MLYPYSYSDYLKDKRALTEAPLSETQASTVSGRASFFIREKIQQSLIKQQAPLYFTNYIPSEKLDLSKWFHQHPKAMENFNESLKGNNLQSYAFPIKVKYNFIWWNFINVCLTLNTLLSILLIARGGNVAFEGFNILFDTLITILFIIFGYYPKLITQKDSYIFKLKRNHLLDKKEHIDAYDFFAMLEDKKAVFLSPSEVALIEGVSDSKKDLAYSLFAELNQLRERKQNYSTILSTVEINKISLMEKDILSQLQLLKKSKEYEITEGKKLELEKTLLNNDELFSKILKNEEPDFMVNSEVDHKIFNNYPLHKELEEGK